MKRIFLFLLTNIAVIGLINIILSVFNVQPYLTSQGINYEALLAFSAIVGFAGSFFSLFISKWMAKRAYSIAPIDSPSSSEEIFVLNTITRLADQSGIGMPEVGIYESPEANAFATGWNRNNALVAISTQLLQDMSEDEVEAILAHEVSHIANGDMVTMTLLQGVVNTFVVFFARIAAYAVQAFFNRSNSDSEGSSAVGGFSYYIISFVFEILFGILASTIVMWFSRRREFRADRGSADLVGSQKMISALKRLDEMMQNTRIDPRGKSLGTMKISDRPSPFFALFSSHPPLSQRIQALEQGR